MSRRGQGSYDGRGGRGHRGRGYDYGRDERERSPTRRPSIYGREERRADIDRRYGDDPAPRGRGDPSSSSSSRGYHTAATSIPSSGNLPSIPSKVEIPQGKGSEFPGNPLKEPRGRSGKPIKVLVNHFAIQSLPIVRIHQYEIRMRVPPSSQRRGSEKVTAMQQTKVLIQTRHMWGQFFVYDGISIGWSTEDLIPDNKERTAMIDLPGHTKERPNQVEVAMRKSGKLNIRDLVSFLQSGSAGLVSGRQDIDEVFKALNALFRDDPSQRLITFPKSTAYFSRIDSLCKPLGSTAGVLEAMRGIHQSVSFGFGRLALNIDTKCAAFYTPGKCLVEVAAAFCGTSEPSQITRGGCEEMMVGVYFCIKHLSQQKNEQKKRIKGLSEENAVTYVFTTKDAGTGVEQKTNVTDYFSRKYGIRLHHPHLPLLVTRDGMFPMEVCFTAPNERYKQPLQGVQTSDFIKFATSPANVRKNQIMDNVKRLAHWTLAKPKEWGITVSTRMLETPAVVLPAPAPMYKNGAERNASRGSWNLKGKEFVSPKTFRAWGLIYFPNPRRNHDDRELDMFCRDLYGSLQTHGLRAPNGPPAVLRSDPLRSNAEDTVQMMVKKTDSQFGARPELILFIVHDKTPPSVYKAYKQVCECVAGIPSQFMIAEKALNPRGRLQYLSNIAMKVNAKLGGFNWRISDPFFQAQRVMILGADSTHPSPGELRREMPPPSYGCLVGSLDRDCTSYTAITVAQQATQELISTNTMSMMAKELLKRYQATNNAYPDIILYLRDGISDHQVQAFLDNEVEALLKVRVDLGINFRLTVINCLKRHHTRFFPTQDREGDKLGNVMPCTVIANCQASNDMYVVSQSALQGTCRPTHYVSVLDENKLNFDDYQRIILQGCFNYQRATRSVSLHSAVYYADQCAERAKLHLREENNRLVLKDVKASLAYTMYWQ